MVSVIDLIMLSKILNFFKKTKKAEFKEEAQNTTSFLQETPQLLDKASIGLIILIVMTVFFKLIQYLLWI